MIEVYPTEKNLNTDFVSALPLQRFSSKEKKKHFHMVGAANVFTPVWNKRLKRAYR